MNYIIRRRTKEDCFAISHVVTTSWNETYKGIVNDEFLNNLYNNEEERALKSFNNFDESNNHQFVLEVDKNVVGFIKVCESAEYSCCEIQAFYIINGYKGHGYGRMLFDTGVKELKEMGFDSMVIGCLEDNPTNEFYKHLGGKLFKKVLFKLPNQSINENIYFYGSI